MIRQDHLVGQIVHVTDYRFVYFHDVLYLKYISRLLLLILVLILYQYHDQPYWLQW